MGASGVVYDSGRCSNPTQALLGGILYDGSQPLRKHIEVG